MDSGRIPKHFLKFFSAHQRGDRKEKGSVFLLFLVSYLVMLFISMLSNMVYYARMEDKMLENVKRTSFAMLNQLKIDIDNRLEVVNDISNKIVFDKKVEMMLKGSYSLYSYRDIMDDMKAQPKYDFIYDYYIYDMGNDEIIGSTICLESEPFYRMIYSYQGMDYHAWKNTLSGYHFKTCLPGRQLNTYAGTQKKEVITFLQSIPVAAGGNVLGQAVILMDQSKIEEAMDKINWATEGFVYLLDKNKEVITAKKDAPELTADMKSGMASSADIISCHEGENEAVILYDVSEDTGWTYAIYMLKSVYLADINRDKLFTFLLMLACCLAGIVLSYTFAYHSYQPIREIRDMVAKKIDTEKSRPCRNEFDYIKSSIVNVLNDRNQLTSRIAEHLPTMRSDYLMKLLKGYGKPSDIDKETLKFMKVNMVSDDFIVIVAKIDVSSSFLEGDHEKEWALARFVVQNVGMEILSNRGVLYFVEIESDRMAIILNLLPDKEGDISRNDIKNEVMEFRSALSELCELNVVFGISDTHSRMIELRECYDEAGKALDYALLIGVQDSMLFNDLAVKHDYYYYPIEMEVQLTNKLRVGDDAGSREILNTLFEINFKSRETSLDAGHYFILDVYATILKVKNAMHSQNDKTYLYMNLPADLAVKDKNIDTIRKEILRMADDICSSVRKQYTGPGEKLIRNVEKYINANYCENGLGLSSIADYFGVTSPYLSGLFKKQRGKNITDFIAECRVKKAKELLVSTDITIAEISDQLGYANEMGITRVFKKLEGITPGVYREQNRF